MKRKKFEEFLNLVEEHLEIIDSTEAGLIGLIEEIMDNSLTKEQEKELLERVEGYTPK